ncbi:MAG TPA: hypothetical protein VEA37_03120 [Flavobacterium sp.]|nr:hypothetical protein [Flavobacterium sp.]
MKNIPALLFAAIIALSAPACNRKGCPADTAQAQVDKNGEYKTNKTKSGLLPPKAYKKKKSK